MQLCFVCILASKYHKDMYEDPWEGSRSGLAMKLSPPTTVYVPFLHSTCPANSSSQLSNSPQELSLASLLGPKM